MGKWTIGIEIAGSRVDGEGLTRLERIFEREFPDYEIDCAIWSGWLGIQATVRSPTLPDALEAVLKTIDFAFDEAGIDPGRAADVVNVTMRRPPTTPIPDRSGLPQTLLQQVARTRIARFVAPELEG